MTFRKKTTFVIGAGASAEFGLPVGSQLAALIKKVTASARREWNSSVFPTDEMVVKVIETFSKDEADNAVEALIKIHQSIHTAVSIDALVDRFDDDFVARTAKGLIATLILEAERKSSLSKDAWDRFTDSPYKKIPTIYGQVINPDLTWIGQFFRILTDNVRDPDEIGKEISIICFNYDRCIEHFLTKTIAEAYQISRQRALAIVEGINIIHPYGSLGKLALSGQDILEDRIAFGPDDDFPVDLKDVAESIRTYTEQTTDLGLVTRIHDAMSCNVLVFLGFGFNNQNMNLLRVDRAENVPTAVYVSAHGFHKQVEATLVRRIARLYEHLNPRHLSSQITAGLEFGATASDLFSIHAPNLSAFKRMRIDEKTGEFTTPQLD